MKHKPDLTLTSTHNLHSKRAALYGLVKLDASDVASRRMLLAVNGELGKRARAASEKGRILAPSRR